MRRHRLLSLVAFVGFLLFAPRPGHAEQALTIRLKDHLAHRWADELLTYRPSFEAGAFRPGRLNLLDEKGNSIPIQVTEAKLNKDGSLASATVSFVLSELPANGQRAFELTGGSKTPAYKTDLSVKEKGGVLELTTSKMGVRLLAGQRSFESPVSARDVPAPVQGFRLRSGKWIGRGWWETEAPCLGFQSEVLASGPVFADVRIRFLFADDKHYTATYRVIAGQEVVLAEEEFNLGDPKRFVIPDYDEKYRLMWDWWGGTQGRAPSPNNLYFSIYDAAQFTPDTARWHGHHATIPEKGGQKGFPTDYKLDFSKDRLDIVLNSWLQWGDDESIFYTAWNSKALGDALAVLPIQASKWIHPDLFPHNPGFIKQHTQTNNIGVWVKSTPDLYLRAPVNMGRRAYLIAALDVKTDVAPEPGKFDHTGRLYVKYGQRPLDKVKDWVLDWEEKAKHPLLFCEPGDLAGLRKRMESQSQHFKEMQHQAVYRYIATGDEKEAQNAFDQVMQTFRAMRDCTLEGLAPAHASFNHMGWGWTTQLVGATADVVLGSPSLTPEQHREARALMAYIEYCAWDKDFFPGREEGFAWGSANQGSMMMSGRALWGKLLSDHPQAKQWAEEGTKFAIYDMERYLHPVSGAAMECPAYAGAAICSALTVLLATQETVDISPILPRLRALADWRITTLPPPDFRFGISTLVTLGDTPYHGDNIAGILGMTLRKHEPDLAGQCFWVHRQSGGQAGGFADRLFLLDESLADLRPKVTSKSIPGFGAILRTGTLDPDETYLCYYHGSFSWGHYHSDQGQLVFYAKGAPLLMDFGSQYQPGIRQACFHNTITYNHQETDKPVKCPGRDTPGCFYAGRAWFEHDVEPFTCLQYGFDEMSQEASGSLGDVKEFAALPGADYARGEQPQHRSDIVPYRYDLPACYSWGQGKTLDVRPFLWSRQVVLVKDTDPNGPNYFLVHDDLTGNEKLEPAFNLWSLTKEVQIQGNRAFLPGQWGVDLDVFIAEPGSPRTVVRELAHQNASGNAGRFQALHKRPFEERQKLLRIFGQPNGGGFCVLVYPRKPNEPRPEFAPLPNVPGVKMTLPDQRHWVIASRKELTVKEAQFTFTGTVAVIKQFNDGRAQLSLLAPGKIEYGKLVLESPTAASLDVGK